MPLSKRYIGKLPDVYSLGGSIFSPNQIAGLQLWLDAQVGITLVSSRVDKWADQSGNGNTANYNSARPYIASSWSNGKQAVQFTGSEGLTLTNNIGLTDFTMFFAYQRVTTGNGDSDILGNASTSFVGANLDGQGCFRCYANGYITSNALGNVISYNGTAKKIGSIYRSGGAVNCSLNNVFATEATGLTTNTFNAKYIGIDLGGGYNFKGNIAEILIYNSKLSAANYAKVETYLNTKYAIY